MERNNQNQRAAGLRRGVMVLIYLAVLTGLEYVVGLLEWPAIVLIIIAILKAAAVLWYFMHIRQVFTGGEGEH